MYRTIISATYTPQAERTDSKTSVHGDVTYVILDCEHIILGAPQAYFPIGEMRRCHQCTA